MSGWSKSAGKLSRIGFGLFRPKWSPLPNFAASAFALQVHVRRKMRTAACIAIPVIVLNGVPGLASAQDSTWGGTSSNLWIDAANWSPMGVPASTGTAIFDLGPPTSISMMGGGVGVGALHFNAPSYTFNVSTSLDINGTGINASLNNRPTFYVIGAPIRFNNMSSAGTAQIILGLPVTQNGGFDAGFIGS